MIFYLIGEQLQLIPESQPVPGEGTMIPGGEAIVAVFTTEQWRKYQKEQTNPVILPESYENPHYCKAESHRDYLYGTFAIPVKGEVCQLRKFVYFIQPERITFIDDSDTVEPVLKKILSSRVWKKPNLAVFFHSFLETLTQGDMRYLEVLEDRMSKQEDDVLVGEVKYFNQRMTNFRKELLTLNRYYSQMIDICEEILENENDLFLEEHLGLFRLYGQRLERFLSNIKTMQERTLQISEVYQAELDINQNNIMRVLTVITAIFLPLTLVAGWYGMNFVNMPELHWRYGYPMIILLSLVVVIICIWIFKKKKFL